MDNLQTTSAQLPKTTSSSDNVKLDAITIINSYINCMSSSTATDLLDNCEQECIKLIIRK